jgi:hypothetical protein
MEATRLGIPSAGESQNSLSSAAIREKVQPHRATPFELANENLLANINGLLEPGIKYESPYSTTSPVHDTQQTNLKRRVSDVANDVQEGDEKRQRIEIPEANDELDLASIIAQATATAEKTFADSALQNGRPANPGANGQGALTSFSQRERSVECSTGSTNGFSSDPQLYMRILSLPMLESLVSVF